MGWVSAIGALLSVAGTVASMKASSDATSSVNKATEAELQRQGQFQRKGEAVAQQSVQQEAPKVANQNIATGAQSAEQNYRAVQDMAPTTAATITPTSSVVDAIRKAATGQSNSARALLDGGYGNFGLQNWMTQHNAADKLGIIGVNSQNSAGVLPLELQHAQHSGDGLNAIGSLLSTAGSVAGMYGATGAPAAGTAGVTAGQSAALANGAGPVTAAYGQAFTPMAAYPWYSAFPNLMKTLKPLSAAQ